MKTDSLRGKRMNIVAERSRRGMSQDDLARATNSSVASIRYWECGMVVPSGKKLLILCNVLDSPAGYLLKQFGMDDDG